MIYGTGKYCVKCGKLVTSHRHMDRCKHGIQHRRKRPGKAAN